MQLGIASSVVFIPWERDLVSYYKSADLFLLTSRYESYCRTLAEAAACGLPFVSSDVGVASLLIESGARGRLCEKRDPKLFSAAILQMLASNEPRVSGKGLEAVYALTGATEEEYVAKYQRMLESVQKTV